jgi:hypothetical protein
LPQSKALHFIISYAHVGDLGSTGARMCDFVFMKSMIIRCLLSKISLYVAKQNSCQPFKQQCHFFHMLPQHASQTAYNRFPCVREIFARIYFLVFDRIRVGGLFSVRIRLVKTNC